MKSWLKFTVLTGITSLLLVGCSNKVEDINGSEAASSFVNTPVQLESNVEHKAFWPDAAWNDLPNYARLLHKFAELRVKR